MYWLSFKKKQEPPVTGLILPGGGARNAYQAGVLKAIGDMLPEDAENPFPVICGTSSGALNAVLLASSAARFQEGVDRLYGIWANFHVGKVFKTDPMTAIKSGLRWGLAFASGGLLRLQPPRAILDNSPLRGLLERHIRFARIQQAIDSGDLRAVAVTASGYSSGMSLTFYQGIKGLVPWKRTRRQGKPEELTLDHLMASSAIPVLFPAVKLRTEYYGDGSMRATAPLSPALHLGANRLLVIGVRNSRLDVVSEEGADNPYPTFGHISGYIFDTLFMDSLDADIERMRRINHTISETGDNQIDYKDSSLRQIDYLVISPSRDVREIVERYVGNFPRSVRVLLKGIGALTREGRPLMSYLMFDAPYCKELMELGYQDALAAREQILHLLGHDELIDAQA
ncbi:MAG: patatin-like phospholipase family protein [Gammaproteobacteria bacterium]|nr:patatin-like phospholipase family protein [Gammaproteobacteria bacterium]MDH3559410.1 patatin-like phospholipase family protein [Gammaproteobacteria bacterium]